MLRFSYLMLKYSQRLHESKQENPNISSMHNISQTPDSSSDRCGITLLQTMSLSPLLECGCCYKEIEFEYESVVQCTEGHLFCVSCLRNYAEEKLFGYQTTRLICMHQGGIGENSSCTGDFRYDELVRALPAKVLELWDEASAQEAMHETGLLRNVV